MTPLVLQKYFFPSLRHFHDHIAHTRTGRRHRLALTLRPARFVLSKRTKKNQTTYLSSCYFCRAELLVH